MRRPFAADEAAPGAAAVVQRAVAALLAGFSERVIIRPHPPSTLAAVA